MMLSGIRSQNESPSFYFYGKVPQRVIQLENRGPVFLMWALWGGQYPLFKTFITQELEEKAGHFLWSKNGPGHLSSGDA